MMKRILLMVLVLLVASICCAQDEEIEITTYYPAPYGDYISLQADSMAIGSGATSPSTDGTINFSIIDDSSGAPNGTEGSIYYSGQDDEFKFHDGSATTPWKPFGGGGIATASSVLAFNAYLSADQTIPYGFSKVIFDAENFDYGSCFNTSTYRFQPNVAGVYQIHTQVDPYAESTIEQEFIITIRKNGTDISRCMNASPLVAQNVHVNTNRTSQLIAFNGTTDYIEIWCWWNRSSSIKINGRGGATNPGDYTYIYGYLVGRT